MVRSADGLEVSARLVSRRVLPGAQAQDLAVTITAPSPAVDLSVGRPPLSLAIVIDRSGSMHGPPIENAKAAALSMLRQLQDRDAFSVVACSSSSRTTVAMIDGFAAAPAQTKEAASVTAHDLAR